MHHRRPRFSCFLSLLLALALGLPGCDDATSNQKADVLTDTAGDGVLDAADGAGDVTTQDTDTSPGDAVDTSDAVDLADTTCAPDRLCGSACCEAPQTCTAGSCVDTCSGETCGATGGICCPLGRSCQADGTCGIDCTGLGPQCAGVCCALGQVCSAGSCQQDCGAQVLCDGQCCGAGQMCHLGLCAPNCAVDKLCGTPATACCGAGQVCLSDQCANLGRTCRFTEECELDEYCEPTLGACVPRALVDVCEFRPPIEAFTARLGCRWRPPTRATGCAAGDAQHTNYCGIDQRAVVMAPVVANLTDDNSDGVTDELDFPDIAFIAFTDQTTTGGGRECCNRKGVLVIIDGRCVPDGVCVNGTCQTSAVSCTVDADCPGSMRTLAMLGQPENPMTPELWLDNSSGLAVGNLHMDTDLTHREPELVAMGRNPQDVIAWTRANTGISCSVDDDCGGAAFCQEGECITWDIMWRTTAAGTGNTLWTGSAGPTPSLADIEGNGSPEVIIGNVVFDGLTGLLEYDGDNAGTGLGVGNNAFLGPSSTVADYDLDGKMEIIAGNTVYEYDSTTNALVEEWTYPYTSSNSSCGGSVPCDGFNAIGNFDADIEGEIVIVRRGEVFVIDNTGALLHKMAIPLDSVLPYDGDGPCGANEGGPPTVADFDGDGRPEIGTASADYYVVVDWDCVGDPATQLIDLDGDGTDDVVNCAAAGILWKMPNQDCTSRATGSSVFDFNGDGRAEVVYADERNFRVYDGLTGAVLLDDNTHSSNTRIEMPLVADIDNDGKAEIVVPEPAYWDANALMKGGIDIWEHDNWVRTRRIWNQHGYYVSNITEDGQVPRQADINWTHSRLNNFRQNVQPAGLFDAADLVVSSLLADGSACTSTGQVQVAVTVENIGAIGVASGVDVSLVATIVSTGEVIPIQTLQTTTFLLPQQSETLNFSWTMPQQYSQMDLELTVTVDADVLGLGTHNECHEDNNSASTLGNWLCSIT
ncbi:MAG: hypothetical protein CO108_23325 [Deltaproteobacteria bacterium CG_4_9_14_3_um_filter_63_12]|nr:MAG: hypothetical protein CO108_23325 [Deltaproteobacteria bacterium CG_4_9_14_3_um_filter_63_12]